MAKKKELLKSIKVLETMAAAAGYHFKRPKLQECLRFYVKQLREVIPARYLWQLPKDKVLLNKSSRRPLAIHVNRPYRCAFGNTKSKIRYIETD